MPGAPRPPAGDAPPRPPGNIRAAIEHAEHIQTELERALEDINEILRILEHAEREKNASEEEIEILRDSLRRLQRDRGPGAARPPRDYPPRSTSREPIPSAKPEPAHEPEPEEP